MTTLFEDFLSRRNGVKVYALIGKSGTGKSFRARLLAERYRIQLIVDDGLLIRDQSIIAGKSAKNERNYLAAVKTAIFTDEAHLHEVQSAIRQEKFTKILLLGTSIKMVRRVQQRLGLPPIFKIIRIEDVASALEIDAALSSRTLGRHVIPVPSMEVRKVHGSMLLDQIFVFFERTFGWFRKRKEFEKSVVRPAFHSTPVQATFVLTEKALHEMILHCIDEYDSTIKVLKMRVKKMNVQHVEQWKLSLEIDAPYGLELTNALSHLKDFIVQHVLRYTGVVISSIQIEVATIR